MANVVFTEPAEYDLIDIEYYIFVDLENPQAAQRITDGILDTVAGLSNFPTRYSLVDDALLRSIGLRMAEYTEKIILKSRQPNLLFNMLSIL